MLFLNLFRITVFIVSIVWTYSAARSAKEMTLEEKVGQLLMVHFRGEEVNDEAKFLIQKLHIGGIIYYNWANGLHSPQQIHNLSTKLQELAVQKRFSIPLLIAVDQEGGVVNRLSDGFTVFPGNKALAMTGDLKLSEQSAFAMGQELRSVGINMNLTPVVDIHNYSRTPVIGIRSFGRSVDQVIAFAKNTMLGYGRAGIITSLKHFPGHGDVEVDSHVDLPVLNKTKEQLEEMELVPFEELADQADVVMTAHLIVPAFDPHHCTTLSKPSLNYLRRELGFEGVIMTDSLVMEGLLKNCESIDEAAILALNAGCDLLLLGGKQMVGSEASLELSVLDIQRIHQAIVKAVKNKIIPQERLDQAVQKVLDLKKRYSLPMAMAIGTKTSEEVSIANIDQHQSLAQKTASLSLRKIKNKPLPALASRKIAFFAPEIIKESILQTSLTEIGKESYALFFASLDPSEEEIQEAYELATQAEVIVFCSYDAWKHVQQASLIESLLNQEKPVILITLRDPFDATLFPQADQILITFSPTPHSIQAAADELNLTNLFSIFVSTKEMHKIAEKIWKNECGGTIKGLTWWNKDENFGSFGIGHFIWYPEGEEEKFKETFPELMKFLTQQGVLLPVWLKEAKKCPWKNRDEFYNSTHTAKMIELRQILFDTKDLQAVFITKRLKKTLPFMVEHLSPEEKENIEIVFSRLVNNPKGLYALIDYLNFKGDGTSEKETYNGQGWGLLQVLQGISPYSRDIVASFVDRAKILLTQRVRNSPPDRNEQKWLKGWLNRVDTYLE